MRSVFAGVVLAALAVAACARAPAPPVLAEIVELRLVTSLGTELTAADLDGKVHVVDFIFTSCQMACPLMTATMKRLYDDYAGESELRFLSISTDPATDTVAVLHEYARRFGVDETRFVFARAPGAELVRLSEQEFLLGAAGYPAGHSLKFVLVDRERRIRGYYDSEDVAELARLRRDLEWVLRRDSAHIAATD